MTESRGNIAGITAILCWSSAALFFSYAENLPIFLLLSIQGLFSGIFFLPIWYIRDKKTFTSHFKLPARAVLLPFFGIGLYSYLYAIAFKTAPIAEANLINYSWPIFFIIFLSFQPNHTLKLSTFLGAIVAFSGIFFLSDTQSIFEIKFQTGHFLALLAAILWAIYCVLTNKEKNQKSEGVPIAGLYQAFFFMILHYVFEPKQNFDPLALSGAAALGLSTGLGYYLWDISMKRGNIQFLGVCSYFLPLFSTALLVTFSYPVFTENLGIATILIILGTLIASKDKIEQLIRQKKAIG